MHDVSTTQGDSVRFSCGLTRGSGTFTWIKDGTVISRTDRFKILGDEETSVLAIRAATLNDAGNYTCIAKNAFAEDRTTAKLLVQGYCKIVMFISIFHG